MRILVLGDSCVDRYITGEVTKINPEFPSLVINPLSTTETPGMAANVYRCFQALAEPTWQVDFLTHSSTIVKSRYVEKHSGAILLRVDENDRADSMVKVDDLPSYDHYLISDYAKGFITKDAVRKLSLKGVVWWDGKEILDRWAEHVFCVKINAREHAHNLSNGGDLNWLQNMVVTRGGDGAELWQFGGLRKKYPGEKVEVRDIVGCGDTLLAAMAAEYIRTNDLDKAITYANRAASIAASRRGTVVVTKEDLL